MAPRKTDATGELELGDDLVDEATAQAIADGLASIPDGETLAQWNLVADELPAVPAVEHVGTGATEVGQFVGIGGETATRHDGEFAVDPETGLITGPA